MPHCESARLEPARLDSVAVERRRRHRPADDPHVRADAARGDRHLHLDHRPPVRQPRRRLGPDLPLCRLGCGRRHRRRAALPPRDELERGARPVVGALCDLEGRPRRLGRHRARLPRRWLHREARRRRRVAARRLPRTRTARGAGGREDRQLVEPGALRQADRPAVGPRDRPRPPASLLDRPGDLPPCVPLRGALEPAGRPRARLHHRAPLPSAPARPLRALHRALLVRAVLDRARARRPCEPHPRPARQHLGLGARLRRRDRLVLPLATPCRSRRNTRAAGAGRR